MNHLANELVLVNAARAGNSDAFASLVSPYNQNVYRLAVNITHNHEDAEDVQVSSRKISQRFQQIEAAEIEEKPPANVVRLEPDRK